LDTGYDDYPFVAEFYDHVPPYRARQDVTFFLELARASGGPVLELGCGTGRILIPTAWAGIEIVGLDSSQSMLSVCAQKLRQEPREVQARAQLVRGDMREFRLDRRFSLVTLPFRPFQHLLTLEDQLACLAAIHAHLQDGGRVVLDILNPWIPFLAGKVDIREVLGEEPEFVMPDGRRVKRQHRLVARDSFQQIHDVELIYDVVLPDGRSERLVHKIRMRYLFRFEAEHLLACAGFRVEELYADYDKSPFGSKDPGELIFVARRH
jgi:SAM-dependent methyltransferase